MNTDEVDPNHVRVPPFDGVQSAKSPVEMAEVTKPMGNTRVKVIPVSAIPPTNADRQSRTNTARLSVPVTTFLYDEPDFRRSSRVQPSLDVNAPDRVATYRQRSFIHRRMDVWDSEREEPSSPSRKLAPGSISSLPIAVQAGFRRKVLLIFDLQLLLLTGVISLLTYESHLASLMHKVFYSEWISLAALAVMMLSLFGLYQVHSRFPWNWIAMVVFTAVFSVLIAGVQVILSTHAGVFCSGFTLLAMCVMTVLCGVKRNKGGQVVFLSALVAGFISFAVVAIGCGIVVGAFHVSLLVDKILAYTLVLEFALIMWFSYDATTIFRLITPDEYMHGVIYFYTDVLVLTMISVTAIALVLLCTACGGAGGGGAGFGYINPTGCSTGGCCGCCADGGEGDSAEGEADGGDGEPSNERPAQEQQNEDMDRGYDWAKYGTFLPRINNVEAANGNATLVAEQARRKANFLRVKEAQYFGSQFGEVISLWQSTLNGQYNDVASLADLERDYHKLTVLPMTETLDYQQDLYGLRTLDELGGFFLHNVEHVPHMCWVQDEATPRDGRVCEFWPVYETTYYPLHAPRTDSEPDHVSVLIESLESVHPTIVLYALEALFHLSEFAMCLDALVRNATVPVLAQILASPIVQDNSKNQENTELFVLGLLATMCTKSKVVGRRVVSSNLLPRLRFLLGSSRQQVQLFAVWIIKSVSKDSELVSKLHEQRIAEAIVEKLAEYEPLKTQRKAFGALCNMITGYRIGTAFVDDEVLHVLARKVVQAMHPLVVSPWPTAPKSLARALSVLQALASLSQHTKAMLSDEDDAADARAIPLVLQLLDSVHVDVKLNALQVISHWVEDNTDRDQLRRVLLVEAPLLSLVRAISDETGECLLVALTLLNTLLGIDDELKNKVSAMTNEVLLRLLPTLVPPNVPGSQPLAPVHLRALNEALKSLVAMARGVTSGSGGSGVTPNQAAAIDGAIDPLVELLRLSSASDNLRLNATYLLVNFAGSSIELRPKMLVNGTMAACIRTLTEAHDDKLLQLCLLGMALLTSNSVDFSCVVTDLLSVVDVLLTCLTSKNASVQANAVWVVSNICVEDRLKDAIVSREGATTLQTILHETMSDAASRGSSSLVVNGPSRPLSSSQRIREYAPKAIKSLGFAPMTPGPSKS